MVALGMTFVRRSMERGHAALGWLDSRHSFSFGDYHDPAWMGFRSLRVINEDHVAAGGGFPPHPHRDMEIFTYVVSGALEHGDNLGNRRVLRPGDIQVMGAGRGIVHSEFNPSATEPAHFLQVWLRPSATGLPPQYAEWHMPEGRGNDPKLLIIAGDGRDGAASLRQDADVHRLRCDASCAVDHELRPRRALWLQVVRGGLGVDGVSLGPGDAWATDRVGRHRLDLGSGTEALLFDLA